MAVNLQEVGNEPSLAFLRAIRLSSSKEMMSLLSVGLETFRSFLRFARCLE